MKFQAKNSLIHRIGKTKLWIATCVEIMNSMISKIVTLSRAHFGPIGGTGEPVLRQTV